MRRVNPRPWEHDLLQVEHERVAAGEWRIDGGGLFSGAQSLRFDAGRRFSEGERVTADYGADKLDSQLLLDHGVLDTSNPQVGGWGGVPPGHLSRSVDVFIIRSECGKYINAEAKKHGRLYPFLSLHSGLSAGISILKSQRWPSLNCSRSLAEGCCCCCCRLGQVERVNEI